MKGRGWMELNGKNVKKIMLLIVFAIVVYTAIQNFALIYSGLASFVSICSPIIAGGCLAFVLNVLLRQVEGKWLKGMATSKNKFIRRSQRSVCLAITVIIALGIVALVLLVVVPEVTQALVLLFQNLPDYINNAVAWVEGILSQFNIQSDVLPNLSIDWSGIVNAVSNYLSTGSGDIITKATTVTSSVINGAISVVFSIIIAIYVLAKKEKVKLYSKKFVVAYLPEKASRKVIEVARLSNEVFSNFVKGQLVMAVILGVLCFIGMEIFRFPYAIIISLFVCVTSVVPMVGAMVGEIVGTILILFISPIKALFFLIFILSLHQLESSIIYPKVVGKSIGLPGLLVLAAVIVGGNLSGFFGALLATPVCAVLYVLIRDSIERRANNRNFAEIMEQTGKEPGAEKKGGFGRKWTKEDDKQSK